MKNFPLFQLHWAVGWDAMHENLSQNWVAHKLLERS